MRVRGRGGAALRFGAAATLSLLVGAGCEESEQPAPPPPTVEVATPMMRDVTEYFNYTGNLEAVDVVEIRARVSGFLAEIRFDESTDVEAGEVVFVIEQAPYRVAVGRAEAALARARAARDLAEARVTRAERAFEQGAANEIELIEDQAELRQAEAEVRQAAEDLAAAELDLSYTEVRTPIAGRIDRHYVDQGNLVGRDGPTLLARVVTRDPMHVSFDVSEAIALQYLESGQTGNVSDYAPPVEVGLADEQGFPHPGRIDFVDNVLNPRTGTLRVRATLPNRSGKLYPGLFARIRVPWEEREDATLVWEDAVGTGLDGTYLLVLDDDDVVSRRPVTLGERQEDGSVVVLSGIDAGERYVVTGLQKARPGASVQTASYEPATEAAE